MNDNILKGALFAFIGTFFAVCTALFAKLASDVHDPLEVTFWRCAVIVIAVYIWLLAKKRTYLIRQVNLKAQITRGVLGSIGMVFTFYAYALLPLAETQSLLFIAPLFVVFLSYPVLKEKVGIYRSIAAIIGFGGAIIILNPGTISSFYGGIIGVIAAFWHACVFICLRWMGKTEDPVITVFYFSVIGTIVTLPFMFFMWTPSSGVSIIYLIMTGVAAMIYQMFLTRSYFLAPASIIAPISYINLFWATLFGFLIWNDMPAPMVWIGVAIIIAANLYILRRERNKKKIIDLS